MSFADKKTINTAAKGVPYYTPAQNPPAGTPTPGQTAIPTLFKPIKIRDITLHNRILVSPMCTYSAYDGYATDFHLVHTGQYALNGAGLVMVEASGVQPRGRISPECVGLGKDSQIEPLRKITDFIRSQSSISAIQLAHAGRKASTHAPWATLKRKDMAWEADGGWPDDMISASAIPWDEDFATPKAATVEDIKQVVEDFAAAAVRAVNAGFDIIEIHGAHGYLIGQFLSPVTNKRTDAYGGSFENRTRLLKQVITAVRAVIPKTMPLFVRISATDWLEYTNEPSWTVDDTIAIAKELPALGVDLLDVSSGGNHPKQRFPRGDKMYQVDISGRIRTAIHEAGLTLLIGGVGFIREGEMAKAVVQGADGEGRGEAEDKIVIASEYGNVIRADVAFVAREFLRDPAFVLNVAKQLGIRVKFPAQYSFVAPDIYGPV